jgi:hypothetical protein
MIIALTGDMGSGKSLFCAFMGWCDWKKDKREVYANYWLSYPHKVLDLTEIENLLNHQFSKATTYIVDEAHIFMDSRASMSLQNRFLSYLLLETRKLKVDWYYTTQYFLQVDVRLRNATDFRISCHKIKPKVEGALPRFVYCVYQKREIDGVLGFYHVKDFELVGLPEKFALFDTNELINPFKSNKAVSHKAVSEKRV